ncbi:MAG: hypothetical protein PF795_08480 [Kiritimatiellae bacterium]|jgi:hypothetical protein|nr:hypothetical protein [Kiritimatiellia bacterium]
MNTENLYNEVFQERKRQDLKWGGPEHDDRHTCTEFRLFILKKMNAAAEASVFDDYEEIRRRLVQVAALAIAAVESMDRKGLINDKEHRQSGAASGDSDCCHDQSRCGQDARAPGGTP